VKLETNQLPPGISPAAYRDCDKSPSEGKRLCPARRGGRWDGSLILAGATGAVLGLLALDGRVTGAGKGALGPVSQLRRCPFLQLCQIPGHCAVKPWVGGGVVFQSFSVPKLTGRRVKVRMDGSHEVTAENPTGGRAGVSSEPEETSQDGQTAWETAVLSQQVRAAPQQALPDTGSTGRS